jgi:hypothetical protein
LPQSGEILQKKLLINSGQGGPVLLFSKAVTQDKEVLNHFLTQLANMDILIRIASVTAFESSNTPFSP